MVPPGPRADDAELSSTKQRLMEKWLTGGARPQAPQIPRRGLGTADLSFAQERLWFLAQLHPESSYHHMVEAIRVRGPLDENALRHALEQVVHRHEALRTVFHVHAGEPRQVVLAEQLLAFDVDRRVRGEEETVELLRQDSDRPFDLTRGPLIRFLLTSLGPDDHVLMVTMHHLVGDGMSMGILFRELFACYAARIDGVAPSTLPELPVGYPDFAQWQRDLLRGPELERRLAHWSRALREPLPTLDRLTDRPRRGRTSLRAVSRAFTLDEPVATRLRALAREHQATLFMTLLAGFNTLVHLRSGDEDIVTGSVVHGRDQPEVENLIGFFANTLALRFDLPAGLTFAQVLERVRQTCLEAYAHRDTPIEVVAAELRPGRNGGDNPLFQAAVVGENPAGAARMGDLEVAAFDFGLDTSEFDLVLHYWETDGRIEGGVRGSVDLFDPASVDRFTEDLQRLFTAVLDAPDVPVAGLGLLGAAPEQVPEAFSAPAVPDADEATVPTVDGDVALTATEREVAAVWREVLGLREVDPDEDFFEAGGHSLRAVRVLLRLRERLGVDLPVQVFFDAPTVTELAAVFDRARVAGDSGAAREEAADADAAVLRADAVLAEDIVCAGAPADPERVAAPQHLFLTGATSFLGAHLLARLLTVTGARLHVLVDAEGPGEAERTLARALARFRLVVPMERVTVLAGSLREPLLGLSPMTFARLAGTVDAIHHVGCEANLAQPYRQLKAANAGGTAEVLRLAARTRIKPVHYVSSPGVLFERGAEPGLLRPDGRVPAEAVLPSGYVRSRWVAEELVDEGRRRGVPVSVYRPGRLGGDSATGSGDPESAFWRFIGACVELGAVPDFGADADFDLVPVDFATAALTELSLSPGALGRTYHLANPARTRLDTVVTRLRAAGYRLAWTDADRWARLVSQDVLDAGGDEGSAPVAALAGASHGMPGFGSLRLDVSGTLDALNGSGVSCPAVDGPLLDRYVDHLVGGRRPAPPPPPPPPPPPRPPPPPAPPAPHHPP
ncbi:thioester reductase domain-containing protein, partial [Streptomyces sp. NPDC058308]|uniref:thioester reductase domain-containing protein n=1 Tax=Streptomyces sp. NPDC058308 TaxID=3346440 RepID=UPI0036E39503